MKRNVFILILTTILFISCSTDENEPAKVDPTSAILGSWRATEFKAADPNSSSVNLGAEILDKLTAEQCYIITFTFNSDMTLTGESGVNYLQINATATGLDVPCPTQRDTQSSTYTYDGTTLTTVDTDGVTVMVKVSIDGNTMTADAGDLDIPNFDGAGEIIFEKF
ncbi:MAG: lipocalin family protein [Maribacter sp.]|uniref:lipocalin family protein n=1 Tax=Maribacter sp. TaxID=1897614 RepID=UPI003299A5AE